MFHLLNQALANKDLDKRFPVLHKIYISFYQKFLPNQIKTVSISLQCKLAYNPKQAGVGFYLDNFNSFEPITTKIFLEQLKPNQTIIDIGANIGYYTILASKKVGPKGKVLAIEPEPQNLKQLAKNIKLNKIKNTKIIPQAISDEKGVVKLFLSPTSSGEHSITTKTNKFITVSTITLDNLVKTKHLKPNLIKIDTEGAEHQILKGSLQTLKKYHPVLIFEYSHRTRNKIFNLNQLTKLDYKLFEINEKQKKTYPTTPKKIAQKLKSQSYIQLLAK